MVFAEPYKQSNYIAYPGDVQTIKLSFAVWLIDDYTKGKPVGSIKIQIKEIDKKAVRNLSGYYFFTDLEVGNYTVSINSDLYLPMEKTVDVSTFPDPKNPVLEIALKPSPVYFFPENATILRGVIRDSISVAKPVKGARVKVIENGLETITDERGNFVLYFSQINNEEEVIIEINKNGYTKNYYFVVREFEMGVMDVITFP